MSRHQVDRRVGNGHLCVLYEGVYRVPASPVVPGQALLAACLAAGPGAVASHRAAAVVWGMRRFNYARPELLAPRRHKHLRGALVHSSDTIAPSDLTLRSGVPVTTPSRTLFDLAGVVPAVKAEVALDDALLRHLTAFDELADVGGRLIGQGRRGSTLFAQLLEARDPAGMASESALEVWIVRAISTAGLPEPERQIVVTPAGTFRLDAGYRP